MFRNYIQKRTHAPTHTERPARSLARTIIIDGALSNIARRGRWFAHYSGLVLEELRSLILELKSLTESSLGPSSPSRGSGKLRRRAQRAAQNLLGVELAELYLQNGIYYISRPSSWT